VEESEKVWIFKVRNAGLKCQELTQLIRLEAKTLSNQAGFLKGNGMIAKIGKACQITCKGMKRAKEIASLTTEVTIEYPLD
jgi:predicted transcriptional regulator